MLLIVATGELAGCFAAMSTIAWLRRFSGRRELSHDEGVRYFLPVGSALCVVLALLMAVQWARTGRQPESSVTLNLMLGCGAVLAAVAVWLVIEVYHYHSRPHGTRPINRPRFRNR